MIAVSLPDIPLLRLTGADVRRFCNGMFTNNVRDLQVGGGQRSAMCDAKGKLLGLMDLYLIAENQVLVALEGVSAQEFETRYEKFIVFDDVELQVEPGQMLTIQGEGAAEVLAARGWPVPSDGAVEHGDGWVFRRNRTAGGGFDVWLRSPTDLTFSPFSELEYGRVDAGKVRWPVDMPSRMLIHELGLRDEVCHFEKGCYVGQEIIHRLDVMGQIRRRLVRLSLSGPVPSECALFDASGEKVGVVTSPIDGPNGWLALSVIRIPLDASGTALTARWEDGEAQAWVR